MHLKLVFVLFNHIWYVTLVDVLYIDMFLIFPIALTICEIFCIFFFFGVIVLHTRHLISSKHPDLPFKNKRSIFLKLCNFYFIIFSFNYHIFMCFHGILLSRPFLLSPLLNTESHSNAIFQYLQTQVHDSVLPHKILIKTKDGLNASFFHSRLDN